MTRISFFFKKVTSRALLVHIYVLVPVLSYEASTPEQRRRKVENKTCFDLSPSTCTTPAEAPNTPQRWCRLASRKDTARMTLHRHTRTHGTRRRNLGSRHQTGVGWNLPLLSPDFVACALRCSLCLPSALCLLASFSRGAIRVRRLTGVFPCFPLVVALLVAVSWYTNTSFSRIFCCSFQMGAVGLSNR